MVRALRPTAASPWRRTERRGGSGGARGGAPAAKTKRARAANRARRRGWLPGVSLLLSGGAKHGLANKRGLTPLGEAMAGGHADAAKQLIAAGADMRCGAGSG